MISLRRLYKYGLKDLYTIVRFALKHLSPAMKVVLLLCFVGFAACNPHVSLTEVIAQVIADTDTDANGYISEAEFRQEILAKFDSDVPSDNVVSKNDFVNSWTKLYSDNHHDAALFFDNMDTFFPFGELSEIDLIFHMGILDPDGDGQVAVADFENFIRQMHPCSAHGHLGC